MTTNPETDRDITATNRIRQQIMAANRWQLEANIMLKVLHAAKVNTSATTEHMRVGVRELTAN